MHKLYTWQAAPTFGWTSVSFVSPEWWSTSIGTGGWFSTWRFVICLYASACIKFAHWEIHKYVWTLTWSHSWEESLLTDTGQWVKDWEIALTLSSEHSRSSASAGTSLRALTRLWTSAANCYRISRLDYRSHMSCMCMYLLLDLARTHMHIFLQPLGIFRSTITSVHSAPAISPCTHNQCISTRCNAHGASAWHISKLGCKLTHVQLIKELWS